MKKIYSLLTVFLVTFSIYAQAPELMSYQAIVRDTNDNLIQNGNVGVRISILQGSNNGSAVYTETHTTSTNDNGLVTLEIGSGNTSDDFSSINWGSGTFFIKSETDPNGGTNYTIEGTSQLLSVPYALYAKSTDSTDDDNPNTTSLGNNLNTSFAFESLDENKVYAWSNSSDWSSVTYQDTQYGAGDIVASNGNFAFESLDENNMYAWSFITNQWSSVTYQDTQYGAGDIIASNGNFAFESLDENKVYAWNANDGNWSSATYQDTQYGAGNIVASNGNFAFESLDENKVYAWSSSTSSWSSVTYQDTQYGAGNIITSNGNFIFEAIDENKVYAWDAFTGQWSSTSFQNTQYGIGNIISSPQGNN